jgi:CPA2 family monovalent cation:H+ antiporter-2
LHDQIIIFRELAVVFAVACACGMLMWKLKQPVLLGYVLAGLVVSPLTPGIRIHDVHSFETMAEVGVILLMFSVGIEFSIPELLKVRWVALVGAPLGILVSIAMGTGVGLLMGWPVSKGVAIGCIVSVASTMVLMRILMDRGELATTPGRVMITLTLVEDLAVVILTVVLPTMSSPDASFGYVAWKIGKALLLLVPVALAAWKLVPPVLAKVEKTCNDELSLLVALTICMGIAAITEAVGLSLALGAFLGGLFLGSSAFAHKLAHQTVSIRDVFVAFFFVTVGMLIDPTSWVEAWQLILVLVAIVLVGKFVIWFGIVRLFGYSKDAAFRVGIGLTQIGEFSFILAQVSLHANLISKEAYNATLAASLITILANATLFRFVKRSPEVAALPAGEQVAVTQHAS